MKVQGIKIRAKIDETSDLEPDRGLEMIFDRFYIIFMIYKGHAQKSYKSIWLPRGMPKNPYEFLGVPRGMPAIFLKPPCTIIISDEMGNPETHRSQIVYVL